MNIKKYSDREIGNKLARLFQQNNVVTIHKAPVDEIIQSFLNYTPLGRQYIIDYYSQLEMNEKAMNFVKKTDFEHRYFYIAGTDAVCALLLLGFKVNDQRNANINARSLNRVIKENGTPRFSSKDFFVDNNLKSRDINVSWDEWY